LVASGTVSCAEACIGCLGCAFRFGAAQLAAIGVAAQRWPPATGNQACRAIVRNGTEAVWPAAPMQGVIRLGPPPGGDFVRAGVAGTTYQSPGYQE